MTNGVLNESQTGFFIGSPNRTGLFYCVPTKYKNFLEKKKFSFIFANSANIDKQTLPTQSLK